MFMQIKKETEKSKSKNEIDRCTIVQPCDGLSAHVSTNNIRDLQSRLSSEVWNHIVRSYESAEICPILKYLTYLILRYLILNDLSNDAPVYSNSTPFKIEKFIPSVNQATVFLCAAV